MNEDRHLCKNCVYRSKGNWRLNNCDYIVVTGHARGCSADRCNVYEAGYKARKKQLKIKKRRKT